jgi:hypothetical protein
LDRISSPRQETELATAAVSSTYEEHRLALQQIGVFSRMRALCWSGDTLYASRGYKVFRGRARRGQFEFEAVAELRPAWWKSLSSRARLSSRLVRDGFHALTVLPSGDLVGVVAGAIVLLQAGDGEFRVTHKVTRGTRPLHIAATPAGHCFWGEYFDNPDRRQVHIYGSCDRGESWQIAHTFAPGEIRHVHNIVYDRFENCLWILTGDEGRECRILRATCDLRQIDVVLCGTQQARAVALVPTPDALYFSSDTPSESNYVYCLDRRGNLAQVGALTSSSIYGCAVGNALFFSTMAEPSPVNSYREVHLFGGYDGGEFRRLASWKKDRFPMSLFQYGNAILPDGENATDLFAVTTIAVEGADLEATLWRVTS